MSKVYFYSDPHFGHRNMAIKRGFKDEEEMNKHIVKQYIHEDLKYKILSEALLIYKNNLSPEKLNRRWKKNR